MAARKLQTEIDRTLKKVSEGVEVFESIYEKMQASTNQTQKEKQEMDLKTQIKRLQRLRDQIKTWVASNDIKDKSSLLDNRRLIETQMEKFKACEKEMKTKAFSKEGLIQAAKLDPKEQEKEEATLWLQEQVGELQMQVEQAEAEIESLQGTAKKGRKGGSSAAGRLEELEHLNERRKWHISRLEIVLRMLNNGSLSSEKVQSLQEDVKYFVESNTEEDFDEDEGIYDEFNLDEEEEKFGLVADDDDDDSGESDAASEDVPPRPVPKKHDDDSPPINKRTESPILKKAVTIPTGRKPSIDVKPPPNPNFVQQPMSSIVKAGLPAPRPAATLPPIRYASVVAPTPATPSSQPQPQTPASASHPPAAPAPSIPPPPQQSVSQDQLSGVSSSPSLTHPSIASPMLSSAASASQQQDDSFYSGQESPVLSEIVGETSSIAADTSSSSQAVAEATSASVEQSSTVPPPEAQAPVPQVNGGSQSLQAHAPAPASWPSPLPQQVQQYNMNAGTPQQGATPQFPPGVKVLQNEQLPPTTSTIGSHRPTAAANAQVPRAAANAFPGSLSDLVMSFENVKQKAAIRMSNLDQVHKMLEGGYQTVPQPQDTEKPKYYVPRNPFQTPAYYPQTPHLLLNTAAIFSQLDVETLFYVFYFLPGTYQQYLAAKELKRQSWRFHVKYLTWFQRHSEPQAITDEYEQGVYVYFDWEGSWCQRKKSDFRFEYRYLSED